MRSVRWALIQYDWYPCKKKRLQLRLAEKEAYVKIQGGEDNHLQAKERKRWLRVSPEMSAGLNSPFSSPLLCQSQEA